MKRSATTFIQTRNRSYNVWMKASILSRRPRPRPRPWQWVNLPHMTKTQRMIPKRKVSRAGRGKAHETKWLLGVICLVYLSGCRSPQKSDNRVWWSNWTFSPWCFINSHANHVQRIWFPLGRFWTLRARPLTLHPHPHMHFSIRDANADAGTTPSGPCLWENWMKSDACSAVLLA